MPRCGGKGPERNVAFALASNCRTISKLAFDACMFTVIRIFGFVNLPDDCTTGSRITPIKRPCMSLN